MDEITASTAQLGLNESCASPTPAPAPALPHGLEYEVPAPHRPVFYHSSFEGLNLALDPFVLEREPLQDAILSHAQKRLLVIAPPASGKSSVIRLLLRSLKKVGKSVFLMGSSVPTNEVSCAALLLLEFQRALKGIGVTLGGEESYFELLDLMLESFDYIFLDDAQKFFETALFVGLNKGVDTKTHVVFFASLDPEATERDTPIVPGRIQWEQFRLTEQEQLDFCDKILAWATEEELDAERSAWLQDTLPILRADTNGHAGLLRLFTQQLLEASWDKNVLETHPDFRTAMQRYYLGALFHSLVAQRAAFFSRHFKPEMRVLLRKLLEETSKIPVPSEIRDPDESADEKAKRVLLRAVIVISIVDPDNSENKILAFATPVHRRFWFREAYESAMSDQSFEQLVESNIDTWLLYVLQTFQPDALRDPNSHGVGNKPLPLEYTFQHEFWRGASMMLPMRMRVAAEVSKVMEKQARTKGSKRLDFWINSTLNWAVELVRSGDKTDQADVDEHIGRFRQNGSYFNLQPSQYRVIEFRPSTATVSEADRKANLVIVHCRDNFSSARVFFETAPPVTIVFTGKSVIA